MNPNTNRITLDGIWNDFYEQIRQSAGNGLIVRVDKEAGAEKYTRFETEPSMADKICIMFAYEFSRHCMPSGQKVSDNIARELMHGIRAETHYGAARALKKLLEQFGGGMNLTALEREREYIEKVIRKTFAAKLYIRENQVSHYDLSQDALAGTAVSEGDYQALCDQLLSVFAEQYVRIFAEDERYAWLFDQAPLTGDAKITRYLVALLCAALISIDTDYKRPSDLRSLEKNRAAIRENVTRFLAAADAPVPKPKFPGQGTKVSTKRIQALSAKVPQNAPPEISEDVKLLSLAIRVITAYDPSINQNELYQELALDILQAVKSASRDIWAQYTLEQKRNAILDHYYSHKSMAAYEPITQR